jgi:hypothetical protein
MPQNLKTLTRKKDWWDVFGRTEPPPYSIDFQEYGIPAAVSAAWKRDTEGRTLNENSRASCMIIRGTGRGCWWRRRRGRMS